MSAVAAARSILTRLHEVMASRLHPQGKLNQVVDIIGEALDSEVCSIYLLREGDARAVRHPRPRSRRPSMSPAWRWAKA